jgi:hypothetical protein
MYSDRTGLILGFHGCDISVRDKIVATGDNLKKSSNLYDWLGTGVYFWENSYDRALDFATDLHLNPRTGSPKIDTPSVVGAIIDLKHCLDLTEFKNLKILKSGYDGLCDKIKIQGLELPENKNITGSDDLLMRFLDRAVIETIHEHNPPGNQYDSVRGMFIEGEHCYPNAGFREKNHIQICIRNPNCIKGYFIPRSLQ